MAGLIASYVARGIAADEVGRYLQSVLAVTPAEAQGAAAELFNPLGATVVIVGEASQFVERLRREHANVTVIPIAELNLDRMELR